MDDYLIRPMEDSDTNFILATWLKSFRIINPEDIVNPIVSRIPGRTYFDGQEKLIKRILKASKTIVCCDKEDPAFIAGYFVFEPRRLHYMYVKGTMRRTGIGKRLLDASGLDLTQAIDFTHHTPSIYWAKQKFPDLNYNPYLEGVEP